MHTCEAFAEYAATIADMGADSICIKDMAGLLTPFAAEELVKAIKAKVDLPLELHTHYTTGLASMTLLKAIEAGVDIIDTAISPLALGTSQPPTESMVAALADSPYDTGLSLEALEPVRAHFAKLREKYIELGLLDPTVLKVDVNALRYQVPGGMLSNLVSQLKNAGKSELLPEVLSEVPRVRADAGYPPCLLPRRLRSSAPRRCSMFSAVSAIRWYPRSSPVSLRASTAEHPHPLIPISRRRYSATVPR